MSSGAKCLLKKFVACAFMANVAFDGFCLARNTDERSVWNGMRQYLESLGSDIRKEDAADLECFLKSAEIATNPMERQGILLRFKGSLFSVDVSRVSQERLTSVINHVWGMASLLCCALPDATDRDRWKIRMETLAWIRQQVERIENNEPEDKRTWAQKWGGVHVKENKEHDQWERTKKSIRKSFEGYIKRCATDVEDDRYSDMFRNWVQAEIEKIIGRPLTDDDLIFKDDVISRRKAREQKKKEAK